MSVLRVSTTVNVRISAEHQGSCLTWFYTGASLAVQGERLESMILKVSSSLMIL